MDNLNAIVELKKRQASLNVKEVNCCVWLLKKKPPKQTSLGKRRCIQVGNHAAAVEFSMRAAMEMVVSQTERNLHTKMTT